MGESAVRAALAARGRRGPRARAVCALVVLAARALLAAARLPDDDVSYYTDRAVVEDNSVVIDCEIDSAATSGQTDNVTTLKFKNCASDVSVEPILTALHIGSQQITELLMKETKKSTRLRATHLANLASLEILYVEGSGTVDARGLNAALPRLAHLTLNGAGMARGDAADPPSGDAADLPPVTVLKLIRTGARRLPYSLLQGLDELELSESDYILLEIPARMQKLTLNAANVSMVLNDTRNLTDVHLTGWWVPSPASIRRCGRLATLTLVGATLGELPPDWLAACHQLKELVLKEAADLTALPPDLLRGLTRLENLYLSGNGLHSIPSELFAATPGLRQLDLSRNNLQDLCPDARSDSPFRYFNNSPMVYLNENANITWICRDWLVNIGKLNLEFTAVGKLPFDELYPQLLRFGDGTLVRVGPRPDGGALDLTSADYDAVVKATLRATVFDRSRVACDCSKYWTKRVLTHIKDKWKFPEGNIKCGSHSMYKTLDEELRCDARDVCAAGAAGGACVCEYYAAGGARGVRVRCTRSKLERVPAWPAALAGSDLCYRLDLQDNQIESIGARDLPSCLTALNLSGNPLKTLDAAAVQLALKTERLDLAGNKLECDCGLEELQLGLLQHVHHRVHCANGIDVRVLRLEECAPARLRLVLGVGASVVIAAGAAGAVWMWRKRPGLRLTVKALLHGLGILRPARDPPDEARPFDALVLAEGEEAAPAVRELLRRLEGAEPPYRLCLPERDFEAGRPELEQVQEAVERARRTLVLASRSFQASRLARAEYQEVYAHAMRGARQRLVVVLLEEREDLALGDFLGLHVGWITYLRWGDFWFWSKLSWELGQRAAVQAERAAAPAAEEVPLVRVGSVSSPGERREGAR